MCGQYMHLSCLREIADRKCYECKTEFPIKDLYHIKRTHNQLEHSSTLDEVIEPVGKRRRIDDEPSEKRPYPSIRSEELARKLEEHVNHLKAKHAQAVADQPKVNQVRKNAKENFSHCLLLGVFEARDSQNPSELQSIMEAGKLEEESDDVYIRYCQSLASQIESAMFALFESQIVSTTSLTI